MSNSFSMPFHDIVNDLYFIDRDAYELCKSYQIEIEGHPKIVQGKNCYSITKSQLEELHQKTGCAITEVKIILRDDKERLKKTEIIRICSFHKSMFISEIICKKYINSNDRRKIRINGTIYLQVYEEDLVEIKRECRSKGIIIKFEKKEIMPVKIQEEQNIETGRMHK